ncbi:hypothetical protein [Actinophytocola sp.]|uniref:hypothetical protein n=1 Tax=Actinophytocola sp. TaxID=1872138 RepID=UPI002D323233|nr:hypothetical protein [Actinophytocola sp.]HYQ62198.1 hypothetical protein [Actinophytocola sp.]
MALWWVGALALLVVVLPVVIALLNRILAAVERIRDAGDEILADGGGLNDDLEPVPGLLATSDETIKEVQVGAVRYAGSVQKLLEG